MTPGRVLAAATLLCGAAIAALALGRPVLATGLVIAGELAALLFLQLLLPREPRP